MPLVRSKVGYVKTRVGDDVYTFDRDEHGRFVAAVDNYAHVNILVSCGSYEQVSADPADDVKEVVPIPPRRNRKAEKEAAAVARAVRPKTPPKADDDKGEGEGEGEGEGGDQTGAGEKGGDGPPEPATAKLTDIKGLGPSTAEKLAKYGIATVEHIAAMTPDTEAKLDVELKLKGAISRFNWIGQAEQLIAKAAGEE